MWYQSCKSGDKHMTSVRSSLICLFQIEWPCTPCVSENKDWESKGLESFTQARKARKARKGEKKRGKGKKERRREKSSWSPNSTYLYFWYLFVELAVATLVEQRNFVSVVPAAKKSKIRPFSFQNIPAMYMYKAQKQGTGRKMGKNPPKKGVFLAPPAT